MQEQFKISIEKVNKLKKNFFIRELPIYVILVVIVYLGDNNLRKNLNFLVFLIYVKYAIAQHKKK